MTQSQIHSTRQAFQSSCWSRRGPRLKPDMSCIGCLCISFSCSVSQVAVRSAQGISVGGSANKNYWKGNLALTASNCVEAFGTAECSYAQYSLSTPVKICYLSSKLTAFATYINKLIFCHYNKEILICPVSTIRYLLR